MNNDDRVNPADVETEDAPLPTSSPSDDEPEADEVQRKVDEIERKVADGN